MSAAHPKIEDYIREDDFLHIILINQEQPIIVPEHKFMAWLKKDSRLEYSFHDIYNGSNREQSGTIRKEDYWNMPYTIIKADVAAYVQSIQKPNL